MPFRVEGRRRIELVEMVREKFPSSQPFSSRSTPEGGKRRRGSTGICLNIIPSKKYVYKNCKTCVQRASKPIPRAPGGLIPVRKPSRNLKRRRKTAGK